MHDSWQLILNTLIIRILFHNLSIIFSLIFTKSHIPQSHSISTKTHPPKKKNKKKKKRWRTISTEAHSLSLPLLHSSHSQLTAYSSNRKTLVPKLSDYIYT